jgi:outer membrane protein
MTRVARLASVGALALAALTQSVSAEGLLGIWTKALVRDPVYASVRANRAAQLEKVPQARAQLLPYIGAGTGVEYDDTRKTNFNQAGSDQRGFWSLALIQPLFNPSLWDQLKQSEYVAGIADIDVRLAWQNLLLRVAQAYFDVLAAHDTLKTLDAQKQAITNQLEAAKKGFELGSATIADTYEAQSRLDLVNASEIQARNALQVAQDALAAIINERPQSLAGLKADISLPPPAPARLPDWTAQAAQSSLEVARAQLTTHIAERQLSIAQNQHGPTVDLYAQTGSQTDRGINGDRSGPRAIDTTVGIQLSIPLFAGGGISSRVREQTSLVQKSRYDLEAAKRVSAQRVQQYFSGVTDGLARVQALKAAEKSSQASLQANQTGYQIGVRVNIDVLNAQQQLYETQRSLAYARYETLLNSLKLKAAAGILTEQDVQSIDSLLQQP